MATNEISAAITSSELGVLWMTFQQQTMSLRFLEHFMEVELDPEATMIMQEQYNQVILNVQFLKDLFQKEGAIIPVGFTEYDMVKGAPALFQYYFDIMYVRVMSKVSIGMFALFSTMSYRKDVVQYYKKLTTLEQECYEKTTAFLLEKGILARPPYVTMPKEMEVVMDKSYMSGFNLFSDQRVLNTIEVGHLYQTIESNILGMEMMTGFAQAAKDTEVKKYFNKGRELTQKIVSELTDEFKENDIQTPSTSAGKVTNSTVSPFSDKLMMYNTNLLGTFSVGSNIIGGAFSLRNDLPAKLTLLSTQIFAYTKAGGKIMIKNKWMEEPPQMEDRKESINV